MKIALSQLNYHIGNFKANSEKIIEQIERAKKENVDLIIFSELAVCGYPPYDLLERREFVESCFDAINEIAKHCHNIAAIVGAPSINFQAKGKKLYNSAYFLQERGVAAIVHKTLLPNYDIFDE
ncbi:MAG: NAD+ synthase, partial [Breznakibacter sp.]|nr:NAD+ synthase [Breznakibacter sp.]